MNTEVESIEQDGVVYSVGGSVSLECKEGKTFGIIRRIIAKNHWRDDVYKTLIIQIPERDWWVIAKPAETFSVFTQSSKGLVEAPASHHWVKPISLDDLVWKLTESERRRIQLSNAIERAFESEKKSGQVEILSSLWYAYHDLGSRQFYRITEKPEGLPSPVYGWAIFLPDGSLGGFNRSKKNLIAKYDMMALRGLSATESQLINNGCRVEKVRIESLPFQSEVGYYTALFSGSINPDLIEMSFNASKSTFLAFLESLCGFLTKPGGIQEYGWLYLEYRSMRILWEGFPRDGEHMKPVYDFLKKTVEEALTSRGIEFCKYIPAISPDAPIDDEG